MTEKRMLAEKFKNLRDGAETATDFETAFVMGWDVARQKIFEELTSGSMATLLKRIQFLGDEVSE